MELSLRSIAVLIDLLSDDISHAHIHLHTVDSCTDKMWLGPHDVLEEELLLALGFEFSLQVFHRLHK